MEMIILSQICYSFHYSVEIYCICLISRYFWDFHRDELSVEHDVQVLITLPAMTLQGIVTLRLRPHDLVGRVVRLCLQSIWLSRLASGASFETRRVTLSHLHWIEGCGDMLHWGIFLFHHFLVVWHSEPLFIHGLRHSESSCHTFSLAFRATITFSLAFRATITFRFGVQSHHHFPVWRSESHYRFWR